MEIKKIEKVICIFIVSFLGTILIQAKVSDFQNMKLMALENVDEEVEFNFESIMEKYQFDAFDVLKTRPLFVYLKSHEEAYVELYEDEQMS